jgi:hypothetical protein
MAQRERNAFGFPTIVGSLRLRDEVLLDGYAVSAAETSNATCYFATRNVYDSFRVILKKKIN